MSEWHSVTCGPSGTWLTAWREGRASDTADYWVLESAIPPGYFVAYWPGNSDRKDIAGPFETLDQAKAAYLLIRE